METGNANERIQQTVNEIYYRFYENNFENIAYEDSAMLAYIVHLCPLAAGPAVYQARDMYTVLVDSVFYQDSAKCAIEGYAREELKPFEPKIEPQKNKANYFKAFPVPTKNTVELSFSELGEPAQMFIYNMQGQLISTTSIPKGLNHYQVNMEQLSEGIYQVVLKSGKRINHSKICKIK
jgi:hypothetical protein